jgi:hypothetical protein
MYSEVRELLHQAKTEPELRDALRSLCRPHGEIVRSDVLWGADAPHHLMCMVEMADFEAAHAVALNCGAMVYGMTQVVFRYEAPSDFNHSQAQHVV